MVFHGFFWDTPTACHTRKNGEVGQDRDRPDAATVRYILGPMGSSDENPVDPFIESWLVNRDPYFMVYEIIPI